MTDGSPLRVAFVGWGAIAGAAADLLADSRIEIVAVATRGGELRRPLPDGAVLLRDPSDLASAEPDLVAEVASANSVGPWGLAAFAAGADYLITSTAALTDSELLSSLRTAAAVAGRQVCLHPGALAGIDGLAAARLMGLERVQHTIIKPPKAWRGTDAEKLCDLDGLTEPVSFFTGSAADAASTFPKNANSTMTTALAGVGPERTEVVLVADPDAPGNRHQIRAEGGFGELDLAITNNPLPDNPKSSAMTALSLARAIEGRSTPLVI